MTRLSQYYQVEQLSRALDFRLDWFRKNKGFIFGERTQYGNDSKDDHQQEDGDGEQVGFENAAENTAAGAGNGGGAGGGATSSSSSSTPAISKGNKTFLGPSYNGSARHLNELAHNALTIVTELGSPDLFITGTCNPLWPEIQDRLFPGQSAFDRPDVVAEVFHARVEAFMQNLRAGKYFGGRRSSYDIRVIEYQHRGLPHFHMVTRLTNMPERDDLEGILSLIDE